MGMSGCVGATEDGLETLAGALGVWGPEPVVDGMPKLFALEPPFRGTLGVAEPVVGGMPKLLAREPPA
jgi:hypothetical protein